VLVAIIWGLAFIATKIALGTFSPPALTALRFSIAAIPIVALARPRVPWPLFIATGLTLFAGQFLFQFFGIATGMPPGLAAIVVHMQAFFTIVFAALALGERPTGRQTIGFAVGLVGLGLIARTIGGDLTTLGLALTLMSAVSWGIGNVLVKRLADVRALDLVVWLSLVPPLPSLALSWALDGPEALVDAFRSMSWLDGAAVLYLGFSTVIGYAIWGTLLRRYPAASVTPFALLVPFVAAYASSLVFGERFGEVRLAGMATVLLGLAITVSGDLR
jgi:O-acetylserine/cysteine efflux transporter